MKDSSSTNSELIKEISTLKKRIRELEQAESDSKEAEAALKESEERYRIAIEASNDGVAIVQNGVHVYVNQAFLKMFKYKALHEIVGRQPYCVVHPDDYERVLNYATARQEGKHASTRYEFKGIRKDETPIDIEVSVNTISYKGKKAILAYLRDITERKKAEGALRESELRYRGLIESSPDAIILHDGERIHYLNPAAMKLLGSGKEGKFLGRKMLDFIHPEDRALMAQDIDLIRQTGNVTPIKEVKLVRDDKKIMHIEYTGSSIDYVGLRLLQIFMRDITGRVRAEETLAQTRHQQQAILDNIPDVAWLKDKESRYILTNKSFGKTSGFNPEDLPGKTDFDIWPRDLAEQRWAVDQTVLESGKRVKFEELLKDKYGNAVCVETIKTPVFNHNGEVIGTAGISRDITLRKKQEKQLQQYQEELGQLVEERTAELLKVNALLEQELVEHERTEEALRITQFSVDRSADPVFWIGPDARLLYVNDITCRVLGYSREELLSMTIHDIDNNFPAHEWPRRWEGLKKRGSITFESTHYTKEGAAIPVEITSNYLEYRGREYNCAFARDITERKHAQETVQALNKELEQRVVELKIINKELETFNYSVSHDLRAPLIAIEGFSRILIEKQSHHLDAKGQHLLNMINKNTKKLNELIIDLLDFFGLGRKNIKAVTIDMEKMVNDIISDFKSMFPEDAFRVAFNALPTAQGDRKMIRQILINLMGNAIKYSRPKGTAVIEIGGWVEKEKNVYFVKDHGIGFPMEQADKIFEVFERLHSTDEFEGTGIGLAIVKRVVHKHSGNIWVEAKTDEGATFYFSLPKTLVT
ncbi:MAG: hypothetical protein C0399_10855 [Syntrophus sp. (in: bacteria)]|nr:hypothetical protein [Syntrophus sp. (in: bacteria)]